MYVMMMIVGYFCNSHLLSLYMLIITVTIIERINQDTFSHILCGARNFRHWVAHLEYSSLVEAREACV